MTSAEAKERLREVLPHFAESWKGGWKDIQTTYNNPDWDNRTRSNVLHMQAVIQMRRRLPDVPFLQYHEREGRHLFYWPNIALFRMKLLDEELLMRNYKTPAAEALARQEELDGFGLVPILTVGLVPDEHWVSIAGIYITSPKGLRHNNWKLDITNGVKDTHPALPMDEEKPAAKPRRFKAKNGTPQTDSAAAG